MKLKKILSLIILTVLFVNAFSIFSFAAYDTAVTSPLTDETVDTTFDEIVFTSPEGSLTTLRLDGVLLAEIISLGENRVDIDRELSVGNHKISLASAYGDDIQLSETYFNVQKTHESILYIGDFTNSNLCSLSPNENVAAGINSAGDTVYAASGFRTGASGEEKGAVGFRIGERTAVEPTVHQHGFYYGLTTTSYSLNNGFILEYDLKLNNIGLFEIETKNKSGTFGSLCTQGLFGTDGKIKGTNYSYPQNKWMHVRHVVDVANYNEDLWIDDNLVIENKATTNALKNLTNMKFQYFPSTSLQEQEFVIDNIKLTGSTTYKGFNDILYQNNSGEYVVATNDVVTQPTNSVMLSSDMNLSELSSWDEFKVFVDGFEVEISNKYVDEDSNLIIVFPNLLEGVSRISVEAKATFNKSVSINLMKKFDLNTLNFGLREISYSLNGKRCISENQLKSGDELSAEFKLKNADGYTKSAVCVMGVYSKDRIVAFKTVTVEVPRYTGSRRTAISVTIPSGDDFSVECFVIDTYTDRNVISLLSKIGY